MAEQNRWMNIAGSEDAPYVGAVAISATTYSPYGRGLLVTTAGNIEFVTQDGSTIVWASIPVGIHEITVKSVTAATAVGYVLL